MKSTRVLLSLVICGLVATLAGAQSSKKDAVVLTDYGKLPLSFEANDGQTDGLVKFLSRGRGYSLFLTGNEAVIALQKPAPQSPKQKGFSGHGLGQPQKQTTGECSVLRLQLLGANAPGRVVGADELPGKANYFIGNDPSKWRTNVPTYAQVKYENIYPGVDLVYYGNQGQLEYDFVVAPGADPSGIQLKFRGAGKLRVDDKGDLLLGAIGEEVRFEKPVVYQTLNGEKKTVEGSYMLAAANRVGFRLGEYDHTQALVIDPVLSYSTYLGGNGDDVGYGIAVDSSGNAYVTGSTRSTNFPTASALQSTFGGGNFDAFVAKINPSGTALIYSTYLGGSGDDFGDGIALDASGNAYVTGNTTSTNFPTTANAFQQAGTGAFVTKINSTGSALVYSTILGGTGSSAIAVDASGNAYVTGSTTLSNFPTTANAVQPKFNGYMNFPVTGPNATVAEINATGSALVYSTYLGGNTCQYGDSGYGIAVDSSGNFYVTGITSSANFPTTTNAVQPTYAGGACNHVSVNSNAFVAKFSPSGSALVYSTYLGGVNNDAGRGIAADTSGNAYVTGYTNSQNFPTANAYQPALAGGCCPSDAFVSKLNASGSALVFSTYLGGTDRDGGYGIVLDATGNFYVTGFTTSTNFPTVNPTQPALGGTPATNAFITEFNPSGSALVFSTYLGGNFGDEGNSIALDSSGDIYVTGEAESTNFPTVNALQPAFGGGADDAFVAKISSVAGTMTTLVSSLNPANSAQSVTFTATVTSLGSPTPTGAVVFQDGSTVIGSGVVDAGQATFTTSFGLGTHSIVAAYGGDSNFTSSTSAPLSQDISTLQSITVSPSSGSIPAGQTLQFTATGHYADGANGSVNTAATWSSASSSLATISNNPGSQGLATGVTQGGPVTVTALEGAISGTAQLTVTAPLVSLAPSSGTGLTQTFTVVVTDLNGLADLNQVQLLFNTAPTGLAACNLNYHFAENTMYLYNDGYSAALTGVVPGSTTQASNSQCTLSGAGSSVSSSGNNLTLNFALTFSGTFYGPKNAYVYMQGNNGSKSGWVQNGTWTVPAQPPVVVSLTPTSGTGLTQTFTVVVTEPDGLADLNQVQLLFNTAPTGFAGCNVNYHFAENTMYLYNDDRSAALTGVVPGSATQASNSQCTLSGAGSSVGSSGNNLTLNVTLTFSGTFTGQKNAYVYVQGNTGALNTGWVVEGTWTVPAQPPVVVSLTPSSGAGLTQTFTVVVTDPSGLTDMNQVQLMFNTTPTRVGACNVNYHAAENVAYLYNDSGSAFLAGVTPGGAGQVSNSQCTLSGPATAVSRSGNNLTLNVALTFSGTFTGQKNAYVYVQGNDELNNGGWELRGTWAP